MNVTKLSSRFYATGQITADDLQGIATEGFKSVVNNRPDGEGGADQPISDDLAAVAASLGLAYVYVPVIAGSIAAQDVSDFELACKDLQGPILLFCRTGSRSSMLWNLAADC